MTDAHAFIHDNLAAYLAGGLTSEERAAFDAHLNDCPLCFDAFSEARDADRTLQRTLAPLAPEGNLESRLAAGFRNQSLRRARMQLLRRAGYATAAGLALATVGLLAHQALHKGGPMSNPLSERLVASADEASPEFSGALDRYLAFNNKQVQSNSAEPDASNASKLGAVAAIVESRFLDERGEPQKNQAATTAPSRTAELSMQKNRQVTTLINDADRLVQVSQFQQAADLLRQATVIDPQNDGARLNLKLVVDKINDRAYEELQHKRGVETIRQQIDSSEHLIPYADMMVYPYHWVEISGAKAGDPPATPEEGKKFARVADQSGGNGQNERSRIASADANGNLTKNGSGTVTLSGNNWYSAATTINNGTLPLNGGTVTAYGVENGRQLAENSAEGLLSFRGGTLRYADPGAPTENRHTTVALLDEGRDAKGLTRGNTLMRDDFADKEKEQEKAQPASQDKKLADGHDAAYGDSHIDSESLARNATTSAHTNNHNWNLDIDPNAVAMYDANTPATQPAATGVVTQEPATRPASVTAPEIAQRKIIRNGTVEYEVRSFDDTYSTLSSITTEEGGFVASSSSDRLANGKVRGTIVVRIPPEHTERFLLKIRALGDLKSQQIGSSDVTKQYTDTESELRGLRTMEDRLITLIKSGKGEVKDLVEAEKQLGEYRIRIEKLEGEIRYYNNLVAMATITLTAYEKDIQKPTAAAEQENIALAVQTEEVEARYLTARNILAEAKARIVESQLKNTDAEHVAAVITADVPPDKSDFVAAQLKQLGVLANFSRDRRQTTTGGSGAPSSNVQPEIKDTRISISLFNLANLAPRETVNLTLAVRDVDAAYQTLLSQLRAPATAPAATNPAATASSRIVSSSLSGQQPEQMTADIRAELKTDGPSTDALLQSLRTSSPELLASALTQNPDAANTTSAKRGLSIHLVNIASVAPRETQNLRLVAADVPAAYNSLLTALRPLADAGNARIITSRLNQADPRTINATITFEARRDALADVEKAFAAAGIDTLARTINRATSNANTLDSKVLFQIDNLQSAESLDPRRTFTLGYDANNVDSAMDSLRTSLVGTPARELDFTVTKDSSGRVIGHIVLDVPATAEAGSPNPTITVLSKIRGIGTERDTQISKNPNVPDTRFARDRIDLTLIGPASIVHSDQGVGATLRAALTTAFAALTYSLYLVVTGLLFILPFALVLYPLYRLARRRKATA